MAKPTNTKKRAKQKPKVAKQQATPLPDNELAPMQAKFVEEYLIDLNATQAAVRAGYSKHTAQEQGSRLLSNVMVQAALAVRFKDRRDKNEDLIRELDEELKLVAFSDLRTFLRWGTNRSKPVPPVVSQALAEAGREIPEYLGDLTESDVAFLKKQHIVVDWGPGMDLLSSDDLDVKARAVASIKETEHGMAIVLHDKLKAIELLFKRLGAIIDKKEHTGKGGGPIQTEHGGGMSDNAADDLRRKILGVEKVG